MRYLRLFLVALPLVLSSCAVPPTPVRLDTEVDCSGNSEVKVSLAVVEGRTLRTDAAIHVIVENVSDKPQCHFDEWNSWGYYNLSAEWTDGQGHHGTVTKIPIAWSRNFPSTTVLQPGEALVREISFDPKLWRGWPPIARAVELTVKVIYHSQNDPGIPGSGPGWTGTAASEGRTITVERLTPLSP